MGAEGTFTGQILGANPINAFNDPADRVVVQVQTETTFHSTTSTMFGAWETRQQVQNEQGRILGMTHGLHSIAPWTATDYASELKGVDCGKLEYSQNLKVILAARAPAVTGLWESLAFLWIPVHVSRSQVQPAPIPPDQPVVLPVRTPVPTPLPDGEIPDQAGGEGGPPGWLWVGLAGVAAVVVMAKRKAGRG